MPRPPCPAGWVLLFSSSAHFYFLPKAASCHLQALPPPAAVSASSHSLPLLATVPLLDGKCHHGVFGPPPPGTPRQVAAGPVWVRAIPTRAAAGGTPRPPLHPGLVPEAVSASLPVGLSSFACPIWHGSGDAVLGMACHHPEDSVPPSQGQCGTAPGTGWHHPGDSMVPHQGWCDMAPGATQLLGTG